MGSGALAVFLGSGSRRAFPISCRGVVDRLSVLQDAPRDTPDDRLGAITPRTTELAASTQPGLTIVPRATVTLVPNQQSGPIRTGLFTIP